MNFHTLKIDQTIKNISLNNILESNNGDSSSITHVFSGSSSNLENQIKVLENALQTAREESFQAGYDEGKEAGKIESNLKLTDMGEEYSTIIDSIRAEYDKALEHMNGPLVDLSIRIAEKIIGTELKQKENMKLFLSKKIQELLKDIKDQNNITIHINPSKMGWASENDMYSEFNILKENNINFVNDNRLRPGECLLETDEYLIDNTIKHQLELLGQHMLEEPDKWIY